MNRRTVLTLSTAACLCGAFAAYCGLIGPAVAPTPVASKSPGKWDGAPVSRGENQRQAERHLSHLPWVADAKYNVQNEQTFVYAEEWDKVEDSGRVRFRPFAMILRRKNHELEEEPITIVCESAVVEFAQKFDVANPHPGRIIGGALEGAVSIRGPRGLSVDGRDFHFSEAALRAWSDNPVRFTYGPNRGSGHGLELDLIKDPAPPSDDKPAIAGVRTVRLLKDVVLDLVSEPKQPDSPRETVHVTCEGSFEFGLESYVAKLNKNVRVVRPTGTDQFDKLENCLLLTLVFEPPQEPPPDETAVPAEGPAEAKPDPYAALEKLEFRRLRAEGPETAVSSQRAEMQARMQELTYDAQARVVALRDAQQVRMLQRDNELRCPEVTARLDEGGEIREATCRGKGQLFRYASASREPPAANAKRPVEFHGEWLEELRMEPDPDAELDLIEFKGRSLLNQPGRMALQADIIRLWVTPDRDGGGAGRLGREQSAGAETGEARPRRLLALGSAVFASPQIKGETERLEIWFVDGPLPAPPLVKGGGSRQQGARRPSNDASAPVVRLVAFRAKRPARNREKPAPRGRGLADIKDPAAAGPSAPPKANRKRTATRPDRKADNPLEVLADVIRVKTMMVEGDDPQVAEVITEGRVRVKQARDDKEPPRELHGDFLHLWNYSETHQVIDLKGFNGRPAHIRDRMLQMEGADIHFDRGRNLARVDGPGVLRIPVKRGLDGKSLAAAQQIDIFWHEKMEFDGETADFYANVRTRLGTSDLRCEEMRVTLDRRISFAEESDDSQDADVKFVNCRDGVDVKSSEYEKNRLIQIRQARGYEVTFDHVTGAVTATGPGTLTLWRRAGAQRPGLATPVGVKANRGLQADSSEWEYSHIRFQGRMEGNANQTTTRFLDRVTIVNGPVARPPEVVEADPLPLNGRWMRCDALDLTQHSRGAQDNYLEAVGHGNVELEGQTDRGLFHANAARVSYDQSKDLFTLSGDGVRDATIWRELTIGADRFPFSGQKMDFIPSSMWVQIHKGTDAQGGP